MNRKTFIQSQGATCKNWTWSWAFVNHKEKIVIFGAWDIFKERTMYKIFSDEWVYSNGGRKNPGYPEAKEYINLIVNQNYKLKIFLMIYSNVLRDENENGPARIKKIIPNLLDMELLKIGTNWYATEAIPNIQEQENHIEYEKYKEGISRQLSITSYERNNNARIACISYYGPNCAICGFNFEKVYGRIGLGMIHVHHLIPISNIKAEYILDPIKDLRPVCPNCHAIIHRVEPPLSLEQVKELIKSNLTTASL
jgi:5-methylcytosine-specific restriction protein A